MTDDCDGYQKWRGITSKNRSPTHYKLLGIKLDEDDEDVIQAAAELRRNQAANGMRRKPLLRSKYLFG